MRHPFSIILSIVLLVLGVLLLGLFIVKSQLIAMPEDWTIPTDDGSGVQDNGDQQGSQTDAGPIVSESGNVIILSPVVNEIVGLPLVIRGQARVFENTLNYRLLDGDGSTVLAEGHVMTNAQDAGLFGEYVITTSYDEPASNTGTVEVFDYSAKDGSVIDLAKVAVTFSSVEALSVDVYWTTSTSADDCSTVQKATHRIPKTLAVAHAALSELLAGPNTTDVSMGYATSIPVFTALQSISLEDGIATVILSSAAEAGGSCRVGLIRSQIEKTLQQFSTITKVIISTEGNTPEDSLQP